MILQYFDHFEVRYIAWVNEIEDRCVLGMAVNFGLFPHTSFIAPV